MLGQESSGFGLWEPLSVVQCRLQACLWKGFLAPSPTIPAGAHPWPGTGSTGEAISEEGVGMRPPGIPHPLSPREPKNKVAKLTILRQDYLLPHQTHEECCHCPETL